MHPHASRCDGCAGATPGPWLAGPRACTLLPRMTMHQPTTTVPLFERVAIIGVGLLGASLGLALKERKLARHVAGVGRRNSPSLDVALAKGAIDSAHTDPAAAAAEADLIVLCTPSRQFPDMLAAMAPALKPGALVSDVGSTKQQVMKWADALLPKTVHFVGAHPMAGSEQRGPEAARADLYDGAYCFICGGAAEPAARLEALWQALGTCTTRIDPARHDQFVAAISHLPHAAAFALVNTAARLPEALPAIAGGFVDTTRVASSDVAMWTDIFLTNQAAVTDMLDQYIAALDALKQAIARGDETTIRQTLADAKQTRDRLVHQRRAAKLPQE